jgi:indole-3-glycerol phosphate synthase
VSPPDVLAEICARKAEHVAQRKQETSEQSLLQAARAQSPARGFRAALEAKKQVGGIGLIAEVKKASPSKGLIRADFDPATLALAYEKAGAACVSVLTDAPYFQGEDAHFAAARSATHLPMIRKDFIIDPWQVLETRAMGADCVLLIVAALSVAQAMEIEAAALELGMDVLLEVHNAAERDFALAHLRSRLLGINNRSLKTLAVDIATTEALAPGIAQGYTIVCESGIQTDKDIARIRAAGIDCFLIGESLMRQADVEHATRELLRAAV